MEAKFHYGVHKSLPLDCNLSTKESVKSKALCEV
jgi:hypothetical protein